MSSNIRPRQRDAVIQSLRAGVVPKTGQHLIQVGRLRELSTILGDVERVVDGGSAFRLIVGEYGAGKTFFLNLVREVALEKKLVTVHADLTPDRRLHATGNQARSLYAELTKNMATRTRPEGGALAGIVEKFIADAKSQAKAKGVPSEAIIRERLAQLTEMVNGYDFASVIALYCQGFEESNDQLKADAIRWLRGEFSTKTEARSALGVRAIIEDASIYDQLKLLARFVRLAGYTGLLVCLDELVNLYKMANTQARQANYEQILRILNDSLQGSAQGIGFLLGGTPEFLLDTRRGLYSYEALHSRLAENSFATEGRVDLNGPIVRLHSLEQEEFYVLLQKIRYVYSFGDEAKYLISDDGIVAFMAHCSRRLGDAYFRTPRTTITAFVNMLAVLDQNPGTQWQDLVGDVEVEKDLGGDSEKLIAQDDELASFQL